MITVIIAGGSGTRLWPLSTSHYPKHLLKLVGDTSLLQEAYERSKLVGDTTYVVTEMSHAAHVKEQLPELPESQFLIEPGRRGTGNCIAFALDVIARRHDVHEPIGFVHSDHHVRDRESYMHSMHLAGEVSNEKNKITLVGIEPTYPSTGFGYIERGEFLVDGVHTIKSFKEKPDLQTAQQYVESGSFLWNCGYFVGSVETFHSEIRRVSPELQHTVDTLAAVDEVMNDSYNEAYLSLDDLVIDYALSEKSNNLAVVSATFDWMDIGSFKDLYDIVPHDEQGNYTQGDAIHALDDEGVYIRNEESKPIAVIGLNNIVVVNTPDGILISRRDVSQRVGEVAKKVQKS
ncbi:mannose-1-phosphate guanylyltransferase [Candidatus Saccharibacteria bacterium]|nr:mannose-1-phosphate guanylyltransferase [Candidatus Saccharibacteria bacterium]